MRISRRLNKMGWHQAGFVIAVPEDPVEACFAAPAIRALRNGRPHATIAVATPASLVPLWEREERIDFIVPYAENASVKMITGVM